MFRTFDLRKLKELIEILFFIISIIFCLYNINYIKNLDYSNKIDKEKYKLKAKNGITYSYINKYAECTKLNINYLNLKLDIIFLEKGCFFVKISLQNVEYILIKYSKNDDGQNEAFCPCLRPHPEGFTHNCRPGRKRKNNSSSHQ
jgi:hypothetical protein